MLVKPSDVYRNVIPTSHANLFVGRDGRLIHSVIGQLGHRADHLIAMPDGSALEVHRGAPEFDLHVTGGVPAIVGGGGSAGTMADILELFKDFSGSASPYVVGAAISLKLLDLLISLVEEADAGIAAVDQKLSALMAQVGANDYLSLQRAMAVMRGNATAVAQTLSGLSSLIDQGSASSWYTQQLTARDAQLQTDINALLDPSEAYFRRSYFESLIAGDGHWMHIIDDRPVDQSGTTFEYRIALPTLMLLISTRLTMMKFVVPDFVTRGTFSAEIDSWWRRICQLSTRMAYFVRETPVTALPIQSARRQTNGGQKVGQYVDWQTHCHVPPPYSISPIGAVDITTGYAKIDWWHAQFDEWYLSKGNLHGTNAGYWPPSIGQQWYRPPPNATGLPDLVQAGDQYVSEARATARQIKYEVTEDIGVTAADIFAWRMFDIAHPDVSRPFG